MIKSIDVNLDWFYHRIWLDNLKGIVDKKAILSKRKQNRQIPFPEQWNGNDYISLAKRDVGLIYNSSYKKIIAGSYALIVEDVKAIPTIFKEKNYEYWRFISTIFLNKRYSIYLDEYQVKDIIDIDKVIGIKVPEEPTGYIPGTLFEEKDCAIDEILNIIDGKLPEVPFIDVEKKLQIDKSEIKQYLIER